MTGTVQNAAPRQVRALTVRQPHAACIAYAGKGIENRVQRWSYRGPVLIHAGATIDKAAKKHPPMAAVIRGLQLEQRAVIAVARIVDCHADDGECTPWSLPGHNHYVLKDVTPLPLPVPHGRGQLGLWFPPAELVARVRLQLDDATAARLLDEEAV
ncbi:hypothetical protein [Streptomyces sp. NBC_01197]|uniref:hypothetical protein n=1 Tax=Streptomyces sp. NBC_01197 TaxID=2903768 RepID=UPI002E129024|nr:hypothetical protein OG452_35235 [Streptomyces sp. NBC_01197]